jgi:hypothetical protein
MHAANLLIKLSAAAAGRERQPTSLPLENRVPKTKLRRARRRLPTHNHLRI